MLGYGTGKKWKPTNSWHAALYANNSFVGPHYQSSAYNLVHWVLGGKKTDWHFSKPGLSDEVIISKFGISINIIIAMIIYQLTQLFIKMVRLSKPFIIIRIGMYYYQNGQPIIKKGLQYPNGNYWIVQYYLFICIWLLLNIYVF